MVLPWKRRFHTGWQINGQGKNECMFKDRELLGFQSEIDISFTSSSMALVCRDPAHRERERGKEGGREGLFVFFLTK